METPINTLDDMILRIQELEKRKQEEDHRLALLKVVGGDDHPNPKTAPTESVAPPKRPLTSALKTTTSGVKQRPSKLPKPSQPKSSSGVRFGSDVMDYENDDNDDNDNNGNDKVEQMEVDQSAPAAHPPPLSAAPQTQSQPESQPQSQTLPITAPATAIATTAPTAPSDFVIPKRKRRPPPPQSAPSAPSASSQLPPAPPKVDYFASAQGVMVHDKPWNSLEAKEPLRLVLPEYSPEGILQATSPNTLTIEFTTPSNSSRFGFDIAGDGTGMGDRFDNTLLHVNPRQFWKDGMILLNNCEGKSNWGRAITAPLDMFPNIFGVSKAIMTIQVRHEGFDLFLQGKKGASRGSNAAERMVSGTNMMHCMRFEHRTELPHENGALHMQFMTKADDSKAEAQNWIVHRVHWGKKELFAPVIPHDSVPGVNSLNVIHPSKLFISGLDRGDGSVSSVERVKAMLERDFYKYADNKTGALVEVRAGGSYALVELKSREETDMALLELKSKYPRMTRAQKSPVEIQRDKQLAEEKAQEEAENTW
ncbi:hypothetical protein TrST_g5232 [Triparma strigata]|uniref:Galectin domain-containing protein n=1 Tax=Triparma strigata TaxID=1606541 RepID=A0A9W7DYJ0_9STRA|nr:hypothetical protein TrST_g5232 [Triparma strigata]